MQAQFPITDTEAKAVRKYAKHAGLKRSETMRVALQVGLEVLGGVRIANIAAENPRELLTMKEEQRNEHDNS